MKRIALACITFFLISHAAQSQLQKYSKTRTIEQTKVDSILAEAKKIKQKPQLDSLLKNAKAAKKGREAYLAYYYAGKTSERMCLNTFSKAMYKKAAKHATNNAERIACNAGIATAMFKAGLIDLALTKTKKNLQFWRETEDNVRLSYGYDLLGRIFIEKGNKEAIAMLKDAVELRKKHYPVGLGDAVESLSQAYFAFNMHAKAAKEQALVCKIHPNKQDRNQNAYNLATLAKYLVFAGKTDSAYSVLQKIEKKGVRLTSKAFVLLSQGLLLQTQKPQADNFAACDSLLMLLHSTTRQTLDQQALAKKAKGIYETILKVKLPDKLKEKYLGRKMLMEERLANAQKELQRVDKAEQATFFNPPSKIYSFFEGLPWVIGFLALVSACMYALGFRQRVDSEYFEIAKERKLTNKIEQRANRRLTEEEEEIIVQMRRGKSFKELQAYFLKSQNTIKTKATKIAKDASLPYTLYAYIRQEKSRKSRFFAILKVNIKKD